MRGIKNNGGGRMRPHILWALLILLPGCAFTLLQNALNKNENLSPEQIEAYNKIGLDVYACFEVGGPPPTGNMVFMLWPKLKAFDGGFGPNCQIVRSTAEQQFRPIIVPGNVTTLRRNKDGSTSIETK